MPFALSLLRDGPLPGVDRETYFGYRNTSRQESDVDMLTGVLEMDFGDHVSLRSLGRLQRVEQYTNATALQGSWCLANGTNPYTGGACATLPVGPGVPAGTVQPPGTWFRPAGLAVLSAIRRTSSRTARRTCRLGFDTGAVRHDVVAGVSFSKEDFELDSGSGLRNADGSELANDNSNYPLQDLDNPYNVWTGPRNFVRTGHTEGSLDNQAVYVFDTLKFNDRWLLNLGARYEHNEGDTVTYGVTEGRITGVTNRFENEEDLFLLPRRRGLQTGRQRQRLPVVRQQARPHLRPRSTAPATPTRATWIPKTVVNVELGTKWDVLENRLALTAALFRNERRNYKVASADPLAARAGTGWQGPRGRSCAGYGRQYHA